MVAHPTESDKVLATMGTYLASIDLNTLDVTRLSRGNNLCGGEDTLQNCIFDEARDIVEISQKTYAIADRTANCIRKLEWAEDQKVGYLSSGKCNFKHLMSIPDNSRISR